MYGTEKQQKEVQKWGAISDSEYNGDEIEDFQKDHNRLPTIDDFVFADFAVAGAVFWGLDNQTDVWMIPLTTIHEKKIGNRYHYLYETLRGMSHVRDSFYTYWYNYNEIDGKPEFRSRFTVLKKDTIDLSTKEIIHLGVLFSEKEEYVEHARDLVSREHIYFNYGKNGRDITLKKPFEDHE